MASTEHRSYYHQHFRQHHHSHSSPRLSPSFYLGTDPRAGAALGPCPATTGMDESRFRYIWDPSLRYSTQAPANVPSYGMGWLMSQSGLPSDTSARTATSSTSSGNRAPRPMASLQQQQDRTFSKAAADEDEAGVRHGYRCPASTVTASSSSHASSLASSASVPSRSALAAATMAVAASLPGAARGRAEQQNAIEKKSTAAEEVSGKATAGAEGGWSYSSGNKRGRGGQSDAAVPTSADVPETDHSTAAALGLASMAVNGLLSIKEAGGRSSGQGSPLITADEQEYDEEDDEDDDDETAPVTTKRQHKKQRTSQSRGRSLSGGSDSEKEDDKKRKWMTKEQAKACQSKFEEWKGSLRGRQEEVMAFSKSIGLSALQVEKRFAYIRKHYERVSKKLTSFTDDLAQEGGYFAKCTGDVQSKLVQKLQDLARHEVDSERVMKTLTRVAANCHLGSKKVVVKPSKHHVTKLEGGVLLPQKVKNHEHFTAEGEGVDVIWAASPNGREHLIFFQIEDGSSSSMDVVSRCANLCLRGVMVPTFIVVPKGRIQHVTAKFRGPWVRALAAAVPGLCSLRVIEEEVLENVLVSSSKQGQQRVDGLDLLDSISEQLITPM